MSGFEITVISESEHEPEQVVHRYHSKFLPRVGDNLGWTEYPADITWSGTVIEVSYWVDTGNANVRVEHIGGAS